MKKPAIHLVVWLTAFFALFFALDWLLGTAASSLYERTEVGEGAGHGHYSSMQTDAEFVVLGSSRARNHVEAALFEELTGLRSFNAGANGQGLYYARAIQLALQARGTDLRLLLVHLSPGDLNTPETGRAVVLLPLATLSPELKALFAEMDPWFPLKSVSKLYRYNAMLLPMVLNRNKKADVDARGFQPRFGTMKRELEPDTADESNHSDAEKPQSTESLALLDAMIADAAVNNYTIVFFTAPYFEGDSNWPANSSNVASARRGAAAIAAYAESKGITYLSFNDSSFPLVHDGTAFSDTIHLRPWATPEFTRLLVEKLQPELNALKLKEE